MVCTGNNGRSPVAELMARNRLRETGALGVYDSISSGTLVKAIKAHAFPIPAMAPIIEVAKKREDVYSAEQLKELDEALRAGDTDTVKRYFAIAANKFEDEDRANRTAVLEELKIPGKVKSTQDQTIKRPDVVAIFAMDEGNLGRVKKMYDGAGYAPAMENLAIENAFGLGIDVYRQRINELAVKVPAAVDRVIEA